MIQSSLDDRVAALEQEVVRLGKMQAADLKPGAKDWRSTRGMFAGDEVMKEIFDEGRQIRRLDRKQSGS